MRIIKPKGAIFDILIAMHVAQDAQVSDELLKRSPALSFDPSLVSVSAPAVQADGSYRAEVTVVGDLGTSTIHAAVGPITGTIDVDLESGVDGEYLPEPEGPEVLETHLHITVAEPVVAEG